MSLYIWFLLINPDIPPNVMYVVPFKICICISLKSSVLLKVNSIVSVIYHSFTHLQPHSCASCFRPQRDYHEVISISTLSQFNLLKIMADLRHKCYSLVCITEVYIFPGWQFYTVNPCLTTSDAKPRFKQWNPSNTVRQIGCE